MENTTNIINTMKFNSENPNNIRLYHGTTHLGGRDIPINGFKYISSIWNCSDDDTSYFYELNRFSEAEWLDDDYNDFEYRQFSIIHRANESGQIQEAMLDKPFINTYVIELIVPPEFAQFIKDDESCEGMNGTGAVEISNDHINTLFKTGEYAMHIYRCEFSPKCALLYLTGVADNEYFCGSFTDCEYAIIKAIQSARVFCDDILDVDIIYEQGFGKDDYKIYQN